MVAPVRLLLFDIDGTLVHTAGAGRRAIDAALLELFGWTAPTAGIHFGGMTDPLIVREVFERRGESAARAARELPRIVPAYLRHLEAELERGRDGCRSLPGTAALLEALGARAAECVVALLTGNIEGGARRKLAACGLPWEAFRCGAFGDEGARRVDLLPVATARARACTGRAFDPREAVVIGDTPADIEVARAHGAVAIAVATGASSREELVAHEPDVLLEDLADVEAVLRLLV
jgi:phosphoglycolate phosphatase-like HAD superfamily hydrolase